MKKLILFVFLFSTTSLWAQYGDGDYGHYFHVNSSENSDRVLEQYGLNYETATTRRGYRLGRDAMGNFRCYRADERGRTYGSPMHDSNCHSSYRLGRDTRGNFRCYRSDERGHTYGSPVHDSNCNRF